MAEAVLGLLFVTSSSRGRNVFRYPPDPLSPLARLSQPIYPAATYTAKDHMALPHRRELFPPDHHSEDRHGSNTSVRSGPRSNNIKAWVSLGGPSLPDTIESLRENTDLEAEDLESDVESDGEDSSTGSLSSDDSERFRASWQRKRSSDGTVNIHGKLSMDPNGAVHYDGSARRGSVQLKPITSVEPDSERFVEAQYDSALSYSLDFLGDMLTPPKSACNQKFEICVNELLFVGHPVTHGSDGRWSYAEDEDEDEGVRSTARGRKRLKENQSLGTVKEGKEGTSPETDDSSRFRSDHSEDKDDAPHLNMFHLVIIVDKPDPKDNSTEHEGVTPMQMIDEVYREIAFKWTAAAYALQVKDNFVAKQAWEMTKMKEKCMNEGVPILKCSKIMYDTIPLDRSLHQLFTAIYDYQNKPLNTLYAHLPTTISVNIGDMPVSMTLSPRSGRSEESWAHWGEIDDVSSEEDDDDDSDIAYMGPKATDIRIEPWQTLLLVDANAADNAQEISRALVGLGMEGAGLDPGDDSTPDKIESRRGSKEEKSAEEDEGRLMKALIEACDVTKRLQDIAHILRYDLEGIVMPLAKELVLNKKAILVNPINARLRTRLMPATIAEHAKTLEEYSVTFGRLFPSLPSLASLIATISASPVQFREHLPPEAATSASIRQVYIDAIAWMLKEDLVVQAHTRVRIFARAAIKEIAWRKLWHRRRERWLSRPASKGKAPASNQEDDDDLVTPKASDYIDPLDATVPPPRMMLNGNDPTTEEDDVAFDSDWNEDDNFFADEQMEFEPDVLEPKEVPHFEGSFIFRPSRAHKNEARWLRAIRETADDVWASKFDLCVQYFDGVATFGEIAFRTGMQRREMDKLIELFPDDLVTFIHP